MSWAPREPSHVSINRAFTPSIILEIELCIYSDNLYAVPSQAASEPYSYNCFVQNCELKNMNILYKLQKESEGPSSFLNWT